MDGPSIFGAILDRDAGGFRLGPADARVPAARRYLPGTMILETSWGTPTGWVIVRDCLLIGPWHHENSRSNSHRRAPTDYDCEHVFLREVRCVNGEVQMSLDCSPMLNYGQEPAIWTFDGDGYHDAVTEPSEYAPRLRLTTDMRLGFEGHRAMARTLMKEGQTHFVALSWSQHEPPHTHEDAYKRLVWTAHHWQHWLARAASPTTRGASTSSAAH